MEIRVPLLKREIGLGDAIAKATSAAGIKPCGGCKERQAKANAVRLVPALPRTLRVLYSSGMYICLESGAFGHTLEDAIQPARVSKVSSGTIAAYERAVDEYKVEHGGHTYAVRRPKL